MSRIGQRSIRVQQRFHNFVQHQIQPLHIEVVRAELLLESHLDVAYLALIISSCTIATLGLLANSVAVIIGAMIIAPLMQPIRGLAFAAMEGEVTLFRKALISIAVGTALAIGISWSLGHLTGIPAFGSEILARSKPNLLDLGIAVAAGGISGYAKVQPKISGSLAGTAIAVALMPPICVVGLGLSHGDWLLSWGATLLYLTNLLGITLSCMIIFFIVGYAASPRAKTALLWGAFLTVVLVIPLGLSFIELVRQAQLETSLKRALLNRTITFQRVDLVQIKTNWLANPPEINLTVRAQESITPRQVSLLEDFIKREMGQPFNLIFAVSQVEEVRREAPPIRLPKLPEDKLPEDKLPE
ncbi:MAG: DUF389 domain-containing protein [Drouetiella hepatica Uher 2000/2452]|uniref:DUF389 domain-containing protein n=1 Tax=Drouetiella hepatica Uher 2000/2452 TaxID=904376 RepID=A0A951Q9K9_9CYAN|nr:DUF389 domain-containing protein [Drouetiella hepatica Uher 2000/2452]